MRKKPILCVDFDGVIHSYTSPWVNEGTIPDAPVPGALRWLWTATEWFDVQIYSSRSKRLEALAAMQRWMIAHSRAEFGIGHPMGFEAVGQIEYPIKFASEKPAAFLTIDDRAICFEGDWSELEPARLLDFKPWNKRSRPNPVHVVQAANPVGADNHAQRLSATAPGGTGVPRTGAEHGEYPPHDHNDHPRGD